MSVHDVGERSGNRDNRRAQRVGSGYHTVLMDAVVVGIECRPECRELGIEIARSAIDVGKPCLMCVSAVMPLKLRDRQYVKLRQDHTRCAGCCCSAKLAREGLLLWPDSCRCLKLHRPSGDNCEGKCSICKQSPCRPSRRRPSCAQALPYCEDL